MAQVTLGGKVCNTIGTLPEVGSKASEFILTKNDMSVLTLMELEGSRVILNIFPSVETGTCSASVRAFNKRATELNNTKVVCVSRDLPMALNRFCGAEGIENVITVSDYGKGQFGRDYGVELLDGGFQYLLARSVVVLDEKGTVLHTELVPEIANEPNYDAAIAVL